MQKLNEGDYHMAEMVIKSTVTRLKKDTKWADIEDLLITALNTLKSKPQDLTDVPPPDART